MVSIDASQIEEAVARLVVQANRHLPADVAECLLRAAEQEAGGSRLILQVLLENARIAAKTGLPCCQDTGIDTVFIRMGPGLFLDGDLKAAVNRGIARGTRQGWLRSSVCDPITRKNTGDNTPAVLHLEQDAEMEGISVTVLPKGCGSENMSALKMLPPSAGIEGLKEFVLSVVERAGPNPCPPGIIGVGIGGTMEQASLIAKKALLRPCGKEGPGHRIRQIEEELYRMVNSTGIGPLGLGGQTTCLSVAVEAYPCHIASLPVAVNIQCHAARRAEAVWAGGRWSYGPEAAIETGILDGLQAGTAWDQAHEVRRITLPLSRQQAAGLRAGDWLLLNGKVLTGRDQTHRVLVDLLRAGKRPPVDLKDQLIYYVGPSPAPPGMAIGSAGPTTSYRMDAYTPELLAQGVVALMGKGRRSDEVRQAIARHGAVYLATIGGAGAFLARAVESARVVAFEELGPEAMYELELKDFPAVVINDSEGGDYYRQILP